MAYSRAMIASCKHITLLDTREAVALLDDTWADASVTSDVQAIHACVRKGELVKGDFYKIDYGYGDLVVKNGIFNVPSGGAGSSCEVCRTFQRQFSDTNPVPLLVNLSKNLEVFRVFEDVHPVRRTGYRTVPLAYRRAGEFLGLFETLRPLVEREAGRRFSARYGSFYVAAGTRNAHLLLPLTDSNLFDEYADSSDPRRSFRLADAKEYGIPPRSVVSGIASDWRVIRRFIEKTQKATWKASVLLLPSGSHGDRDKRKTPATARALDLALFREGFRQLQDALEAFTGPRSRVEATSVFMNIEKESAHALLDFLKSAAGGRAFVHCPTGDSDANGPWLDLERLLGATYDVTNESYLPLILEPRPLDSASKDAGLVSWIHPLIPQGLRFITRKASNEAWVEKFVHQLGDAADVVGVYTKGKEDIARIMAGHAGSAVRKNKAKQVQDANVVWPNLLGRGRRMHQGSKRLFRGRDVLHEGDVDRSVLEEFLTIRTVGRGADALP